MAAAQQVLGRAEPLLGDITNVLIQDDNTLVFTLRAGSSPAFTAMRALPAPASKGARAFRR